MPRFSQFLSIAVSLALLAGIMSGCQSGGSQQQSEVAPTTPGQEEPVGAPEEEAAADEVAEPMEVPDVFGLAAEGNDSVVQAILNSYSTKEFTGDAVSDDDLQLILQSGAKAPSARNSQPWHFSVVTGGKVTEIMSQAVEGNVLIVISGQDGTGDGMAVEYDCGLASAYLYLAAQSLGYGAHIYMSGVTELNENRRDELQIPDGNKAIMMMLIGGVADDVDAVTAATDRNPLEQTVSYIE